MLRPRFRDDKTTQAAALLLKRAGGTMNHLVLVKLIYMADRQALLGWGRPITFDAYVSMQYGPVVSRTLDLINGQTHPGQTTYWSRYISDRERNTVSLLHPEEETPADELSEAEERLLNRIFDEFGGMGPWELVELTHEFGEWEDPGGGAIGIEVRDILRAGDKTPIEVAAIEEELAALAQADRFRRPSYPVCE